MHCGSSAVEVFVIDYIDYIESYGSRNSNKIINQYRHGNFCRNTRTNKELMCLFWLKKIVNFLLTLLFHLKDGTAFHDA